MIRLGQSSSIKLRLIGPARDTGAVGVGAVAEVAGCTEALNSLECGAEGSCMQRSVEGMKRLKGRRE